MTRDSRLDMGATVLFSLGIASAVVNLFYRPFIFGPVGLVFVLTATIMSTHSKRLGGFAISAVALFWLIGASIAVWYSNPLY